MTAIKLDTDYLIAGTGAVGMAFADIILSETDAEIVMVDLHAKPGGHWNDAYPFVTLHQPSSFYGVSSRELGSGQIDRIGLNQGMFELAGGSEVSAYFDLVMREQFLPTGRVKYFPSSEYLGDGQFRSLLSGQLYQVDPRRKTVDATYLKTSVPSTHKPNFSVDSNVRFIPINDLTKLEAPADGYTIIGGGKTAIDACLWLLTNGVDPDQIQWVRPRDAWLLNRANAQPDMAYFQQTMGAQATQLEAIAAASDFADLCRRLEEGGIFLRIDTDIEPTMFHAATVSIAELAELRRIKNVVRLGHVTHIETDQIHFEQGTLPSTPQRVHVDCSARAIPANVPIPVFQGDTIIPQTIRAYQPAFSAAMIAHVEVNYDDDEKKNQLCGVVPLPNHATDWPVMTGASMMNQYLWSQEPELREWLRTNRLEGFSKLSAGVSEDDTHNWAIVQRIRASAMEAASNLQRLVS